MAGLILRIDDRLVHGQVVIGWGRVYQFEEIIVANNEMAVSDWEVEMMQIAAGEIPTRVMTLANVAAFISAHLEDSTNRLVLVESVRDIRDMAAQGLPLININVGGIHYEKGRKEFLPYMFLSREDIGIFQELIAKGYDITCQDVPSHAGQKLEKVLERKL